MKVSWESQGSHQSSPSDNGPTDYREIAESILGAIDWEDSNIGYCKCPGEHLHTSPTGSKDCKVTVGDGRAPTIYCFHESCKPEVDKTNTLLRSELGKADARSERQLVGKRKFHKPVPTHTEIPDDTERFLRYVFEPEDYVSIEFLTKRDTGDRPEGRGTNYVTRDEWIAGIDGDEGKLHPTEFGGEEATGYYVRINPIKKGSGGTNKDVTNFKYILLESDEGKKEEQELMLRNARIPIAALIDSGGKSVHAWVRVDAANEQQYHKRRQQIYDVLPEKFKVDTQCKNPSRYSRLPGAMRGDEEQKLIGLGIGPRDFDEWQMAQDESEEPPEFGPDFLRNFDVENDPNNMLGKRWLCKGGVFGFVGPTGAGKSTLIMQGIMSWALGRDFFGIKPVRPLKSYVMQYENDEGDMADQYQGVFKSLNLSARDQESLQENLIFRRVMKHVGMDFGRIAKYTIERHEPDIIWVDPISMYIGGDLSDQEYVTQWLAQMLVPLAKDTGTMIGLIQHTGKGTMDPRTADAMTASDMAYRGFGSSIIANTCREMINLAEMQVKEGTPRTFRLDLCKRQNKAGMRNVNGELSNYIFIQHGIKNVSWQLCEKPEPPEKKKK